MLCVQIIRKTFVVFVVVVCLYNYYKLGKKVFTSAVNMDYFDNRWMDNAIDLSRVAKQIYSSSCDIRALNIWLPYYNNYMHKHIVTNAARIK